VARGKEGGTSVTGEIEVQVLPLCWRGEKPLS
jgi:hypothetical protein